MNIKAFDLYTRGRSANAHDYRIELRRASDHAFVGWVQAQCKVKDGASVFEMNVQLIERQDLTALQLQFAQTWLAESMSGARKSLSGVL